MIDSNYWHECHVCDGAGDIWYIDDATGDEWVEPCPHCNGDGGFKVEDDEQE